MKPFHYSIEFIHEYIFWKKSIIMQWRFEKEIHPDWRISKNCKAFNPFVPKSDHKWKLTLIHLYFGWINKKLSWIRLNEFFSNANKTKRFFLELIHVHHRRLLYRVYPRFWDPRFSGNSILETNFCFIDFFYGTLILSHPDFSDFIPRFWWKLDSGEWI